MNDDKDGGAAFPMHPTIISQRGDMSFGSRGISKLEWFAGMALQGLLSGPLEIQREFINVGAEGGLNAQESITSCAFECAEAMLAESERRSKA